MEEDTEPQEEVIEQVAEEPEAQEVSDPSDDVEVEDVPEQQTEKSVPLHYLQKERKKRQEEAAEKQRLEVELKYLREQYQAKAPAEPDPTQFEAPTKGEVDRKFDQNNEEILRKVEERIWIKANPEKYQRVTEDLDAFLKQRPNLASAISGSSNRYEEAYTLMEALTPKQQMQLKEQPKKKPAPGNPGAVPKAASMNQAVDVMSMTDKEYSEWRQAQKRRR